MNIVEIQCFLSIPRTLATWQWIGDRAEGEKRFEQRFGRKPDTCYSMKNMSHWFVVGVARAV